MKVKFLKDHLENKKGDIKTVNDWRANYWVKTGVAYEVVEKKELKQPKKKETKNAAPKTETKNKK